MCQVIQQQNESLIDRIVKMHSRKIEANQDAWLMCAGCVTKMDWQFNPGKHFTQTVSLKGSEVAPVPYRMDCLLRVGEFVEEISCRYCWECA